MGLVKLWNHLPKEVADTSMLETPDKALKSNALALACGLWGDQEQGMDKMI